MTATVHDADAWSAPVFTGSGMRAEAMHATGMRSSVKAVLSKAPVELAVLLHPGTAV